MKRRFSAPLALGLGLLCGTAGASDADPWFGRDKALHFGVSLALASGGYAASSPWLDTPTQRALAGGGFSLTLGASKELWDMTGHGDPSWRDFTWDVLGAAVGVALAVSVDALAGSKGEAPTAHASAQGLAFHF